MDHFAQYIVGVGAAAVIAAVAARLRFLASSGAWATFLLGSVVFGLGGLQWSVPLLTFFILSSILSKYAKPRLKSRYDAIFEKGSTRDAGQVWANGGVAGAVVILHAFFPDPLWYLAELGALAGAAADTWGTEIGLLGRGRVISVGSFKSVEPGQSGGISLVGTLGGGLGALSVAASGAFWTSRPAATLGIATTAGLAGMFADSLVGSVVQAGYRCSVCGVMTERSAHCGVPARLERGMRSMNNDAVNILCCLVGALAAALLARFV